MSNTSEFLMYRIGVECIKWCRKQYGKRSHRPVPKLALTALRKDYAEFNYTSNRIEVDITKHLVKKKQKYVGLDLEQYVDTIIHEYQHYLQNWSYVKAVGFNEQGEYIEDNPYEQLAVKVAQRDTLECVEYLTELLNLQTDEQ